MRQAWWKEATVYQIYPRSFCDSNGDGIGDLAGIHRKLDYLQALGVDVLWLCPIYQSPNADNGYDVANYHAILPEFGTLGDFTALLAEVHRRGMRLIMDLVVNHTSDEHAWFTEARSSRSSGRRDYYIWADPVDGREPNNWRSFFGGPAWELDARTGQYYLHLFHRKQPDLNWANPEVRREVHALMRWWLDLGVDGFRMDVINFIAKAPGLPDSTNDPALLTPPFVHVPGIEHYADTPRVHDYLQEMHREVLAHYDVMTVGECHYLDPQRAVRYVAEDRRELCLLFQFDQIFSRGDHAALRRAIEEWYAVFHPRAAWTTTTLGNHDFPRVVSVFGDDQAYWRESATALATLLLTAPGTPFLYQGDEIGMTNLLFDRLEDFDDVQALGHYRENRAAGMPEAEAFRILQAESRDHARTPLQWSAGTHAGFTDGRPWLKVNPNHSRINVAAQEGDPKSILNYYRNLIRLRREERALVYGEFTPRSTAPSSVVHWRTLDSTRLVTALNLSGRPVWIEDEHLGSGRPLRLLISNGVAPSFLQAGESLELAPWEARVYRAE